MTNAVERALRLHESRQCAAEVGVVTPSCVNIIGEHVDYNDGIVMPMALPMATAIIAGGNTAGRYDIHSEGFGTVVGSFEEVSATSEGWFRHIAGSLRVLRDRGTLPDSLSLTITSDIPQGAGLSSSASLCVGVISAVSELVGDEIEHVTLARLAQRVEHEHVGVPCGIMDQLAVTATVEGCALLLDCRTLNFEHVRLPNELMVAVLDTGTRRRLDTGEYAKRRASCERAAAEIGMSLRDSALSDLTRVSDDIDRRRARHVITEIRRVERVARALHDGAYDTVGELLNESHDSLQHDFEVSGVALDRVVDNAQRAPGCLGARMTGGGFAGCAVALVHRSAIDDFTSYMASDRNEQRASAIYIHHPAGGVNTLRLG